MKVIDMDSWPRREIFDFFSGMRRPFYSVSYRQDVTRLYNYAKAHKLSFYYCLIYLVTCTMNSLEAFRYSIMDGRVVLLDARRPSFTDMKPGAEYFHVCSMPLEGGLADFCAAARQRSHSQSGFISCPDKQPDLIYVSCLPWLDITGLTNEGDMLPDDCIPRITWGKFIREGERVTLGISLEVNHRFIDGADIGRFSAELDRLIAELS